MKRIAWAAAAALVHVALMSAAIETFLSGSPVRWWVAGVVAVYYVALLACGYVSSSVRASANAESLSLAGLGVFLLIFVSTPWLPQGLTSGLRLFGASTSTLMSTFTAGVIILVGLSLARLRRFPRWARYASAAIGVYGCVSIAFGVVSGTPFPSLLQGHGFWTKLPRWLQGATLSAAVLLPLALLVQAVQVIGLRRHARSVGKLAYQATAVLTALSMVSSALLQASGVVSIGLTGSARQDPPPAPDPIGSMDDWRRQTFGDREPLNVWEQFSKVAAQELKRQGADPSDIGAQANMLGRDPRRIFEFMRDQIAVEPYEGVLRGARGTLAAGAGNALDRALLAQALLSAEGIESRLVTGELSEDQAGRLLSHFLASVEVPRALRDSAAPRDDARVTSESRELSTRFGVPEQRVHDLVQHARVKNWEFWQKADREWATQYTFLADQLRRAGVQTAVDATVLHTQLNGRLSRHYWLQVRDPGGSWSEFDPTFPDASPGTSYAASPVAVTEVPADLYHRFELKLVYHTTSGESPKEEVLLDGTIDAAGALFSPLVLQIQPVDKETDPSLREGMSPSEKIASLRKMKRFRGILSDGQHVTGGRIFDLEGTTYDDGKTLKSSAEALLGGFFGGGEEDKGKFVELQAVLRLTGPGRDARTQTRTLVKATDLASATFAPPILEWRILVQPQWISSELAAFQLLRAATASGDFAAAVLSKKDLKDAPAPPVIPSELLQLALLRQTAVARVFTAHSGVRALVDEPLVTISGHRLTSLDERNQTATSERTIDIVESAIRYVPTRDDGTGMRSFDAGLQQGAADCTLEDAFLREAYPDGRSQSAAVILGDALREHRPTAYALAGEPGALRGGGMGAPDINWIHDNELGTSHLVAAVRSDGTAVWWSVRADGNSILRVSGGRGQGEVEHEENTFLVAMKVAAFLVCAAELVKHLHEEPGAGMTGWKLIWCAVATGASVGMFVAGAHTLSTVFLIVEAAEFLLTGAIETNPLRPAGRRAP